MSGYQSQWLQALAKRAAKTPACAQSGPGRDQKPAASGRPAGRVGGLS